MVRYKIGAIIISLLFIFMPFKGYALDYIYCSSPQSSASCNIAYQKIRTLQNPLTKKKFFDDGIYLNPDGSIFAHPEFHVAKADLDRDGYNEIIIALSEFSEETTGTICKKNSICPHYILQDRNPKNTKPYLKNIKAFGPIYTKGIGLSTDEVVGGYRSLRVYSDVRNKKFSVYQYDRKNDSYFNISTIQ